MQYIKIKGNKKLSGSIKVSGAKNSVVALICAALLADDVVYLDNVPNISDVHTLIEILTEIGCKVTYDNEEMMIDSRNLEYSRITSEAVHKMRASYYLMGAYIARFGKVEFPFPGGCNLGPRPIDLHLFAFERLGCKVSIEDGIYKCKTKNLKGGRVFLDFASVGATINAMIAATTAEGITTIENAAEETEIVDVANFLNSMGAKVRGAGTSMISIEGVSNLKGSRHTVVPDRIVAGTYVLIGALTSKKLRVENLIPMHIESLLAKLENAGVKFEIGDDYVEVHGLGNYKAFDTTTQTYPGFPTDLQQPLSVFLTQCEGMSSLTETIFTDRMRHVDYLNKMQANIKLSDNTAVIMGPTQLYGNTVVATDLRGGMCLVMAGLIAKGETYISEIDHILRGYENIIEILNSIGADVSIVDELPSKA